MFEKLTNSCKMCGCKLYLNTTNVYVNNDKKVVKICNCCMNAIIQKDKQ